MTDTLYADVTYYQTLSRLRRVILQKTAVAEPVQVGLHTQVIMVWGPAGNRDMQTGPPFSRYPWYCDRCV
ncbi:hypothetical protein [Nocardia terpenica]|uniref:hypothetical protein n=1 Tax=Nocardia terpenica TaxID=455432 RepID=UPI00142D4067|nr:hypothetical protein [Nocardia terpenica]